MTKGMMFSKQEMYDGLPFQDYELGVKIVIENIFREAWQQLLSNSYDWSSCSEDDITAKLHIVLDSLRRREIVDGFNPSMFQTIVREEHSLNYNGESIDKQPDFTIRLQDVYPGLNRLYRALYVECKPIDKAHPIGTHYCKKGIKRYVDGDYAWAMKSGMMVAYMQREITVEEFNKSLKKFSIECGVISELKVATDSPNTLVSEHSRNWRYPQTEKSPGHITLRHVWLNKLEMISEKLTPKN
ncbi:hypothetical protein HYW20_07020 [Candidatus Woesearchaeota archaeon]|nr:hypothetical protein [Candidatus Woesearchaeota archaeon]